MRCLRRHTVKNLKACRKRVMPRPKPPGLPAIFIQKAGPISGPAFFLKVERVMGIEPTCAAWKAAVLPLNYTRSVAPRRQAGARWSQAPASSPEWSPSVLPKRGLVPPRSSALGFPALRDASLNSPREEKCGTPSPSAGASTLRLSLIACAALAGLGQGPAF